MTEGITCYERDEALCEDQMCLRVGCRLRNERLGGSEITPEQNPALLEVGLNYHIGQDGKEQLFASVEVTGLTNAQIAALHEYAKAMRDAGVLDLLNG